MSRKFVLSSWKGYEIDSSEFATAFEVKDVPKTIKAFIESPFIKKRFSCSLVFHCLLNAIALAKLENKSKVDSIIFNDKNLDQLIDYHLTNVYSVLEESKWVVRGRYGAEKKGEPTTDIEKARIVKSLDRTNRTSYEHVDVSRTTVPVNFIDLEDFKEIIKKNRKTRPFRYRNPFLQALEKYEHSWMSQEDLLELSIFIKLLTIEFPHLVFEFMRSTFTFTRRTDDEGEGAYYYHFTFSGVPRMFVQPWYESEEWDSVLASIKIKTEIHEHPTPF